MGKHIIFSVILNILIIASVIIGIYGFKMGNYFIPILCAAAFGLTVFYKFKHIKVVRSEMQIKANEKMRERSKKKK
jgi:hypothetical protein